MSNSACTSERQWYSTLWREWGLMVGLYLVLSLILMLAARVIPFFHYRATGQRVVHQASASLNVGGLLLTLFFIGANLFTSSPVFVAGLAGMLCLLYAT